MSQLDTLGEFLAQTGARIRVFDMGRRIVKIGRGQMEAFERGQQPYPFPLQQKAWLAMLLWTADEAEHVVWFLQWPLDEAGMLIPAARDDFLRALLARLGEAPDTARSGLAQALKDSPYTFKPAQARMAVFHAKAVKVLGQPPSDYYDHARDYFAGKLGFDQWSFVGLQGIADICARLDQDGNAQLLAQALPQLPEQPLAAVCQCLENETPSATLGQALADTGHELLQHASPEAAKLDALARGLSNVQTRDLRGRFYQSLLDSALGSRAETLAAIAGRGWEALRQPELALTFLERLARCEQGQAFFNQIVADLVYLPGMRQPLFQALRQPERSPTLAQAVGALFGAIQP